MTKSNGDNGDQQRWRLTKEKVLMRSGLTLIAAEFINAEIISGTFHLEFVIAGCALCGISLAQGLDRK